MLFIDNEVLVTARTLVREVLEALALIIEDPDEHPLEIVRCECLKLYSLLSISKQCPEALVPPLSELFVVDKTDRPISSGSSTSSSNNRPAPLLKSKTLRGRARPDIPDLPLSPKYTATMVELPLSTRCELSREVKDLMGCLQNMLNFLRAQLRKMDGSLFGGLISGLETFDEDKVISEFSNKLIEYISSKFYVELDTTVPDCHDVQRFLGHAAKVNCFFELYTAVHGSSGSASQQHLLVTGGSDKVIRVWDLNLSGVQGRNAAMGLLLGHNDAVMAVTVANRVGGALIVSGSADSTIKLWDLEKKKLKVTLREHAKAVTSVVCFANRWIASGSADGSIKFWDLDTGVTAVDFTSSTSGEKRDTSSGSSTPRGGEPAVLITPRRAVLTRSASSTSSTPLHGINSTTRAAAHKDGVCCLLLIANNTLLLSGGLDGKIKVWDIASANPSFACLQEVSAHRGSVTCLAVYDSFVVSGGADGSLVWWTYKATDFIRIGNDQKTILTQAYVGKKDMRPSTLPNNVPIRQPTKLYRSIAILPSSEPSEGTLVLAVTKGNKGWMEVWNMQGEFVTAVSLPNETSIGLTDSDEECLGLDDTDEDTYSVGSASGSLSSHSSHNLISSVICVGASKCANIMFMGSNDNSAAAITLSDSIRQRAKTLK